MAKPNTRSNRYRSTRITLRMTEEEKEMLAEKARQSGLTRQEFILRTIASKTVSADSESQKTAYKSLYDLQNQVRGMAVNCNQMARVANSIGMIPTGKDLQELSREYNYIAQEVMKLWQLLKP